MSLIVCPECGNEVSDKAKACPNCGYPIPQSEIVEEKMVKTCPECGAIVDEDCEACSECGFPMRKESESEGITIANKGNLNIPEKNRLIINGALILVGIIMLVVSFKTRFSEEYRYNESIISEYEQDIIEYRGLKQENLDAANSYRAGFFKDSYKTIANAYQELIDNAEEDIVEYQGKQRIIVIKSIVFFTIALVLIGIGFSLMKTRKEGVSNGAD